MARLLCLVGMDFNPPAPCGAGHSRSDTTRGIENFNPPAPCGAGPAADKHADGGICHFNPPAPCGAGLHAQSDHQQERDFNPPAPCGAGLWYTLTAHSPAGFQSTRPMRGGTIKRGSRSSSWIISIHPPHAGRDKITDRPKAGKGISIHPPHAGRDDKDKDNSASPFISIHPPHAGRDAWASVQRPCYRNFNPPAPCGAGRA